MRVGKFSISPAHYNDIPDDLLQGQKNILEFGCAIGLNQIISRHREFFINNNREGHYLGVDLEPYQEKYLNIIVGDIRDFKTEKKYDVVIALHVLEHIELSYWNETIQRLKSFVAQNGVLLIGTPNEEPDDNDEYHCVFNITVDMLKHYITGADVLKIKKPFAFAEDGASFSWALVRYIKRRITHHPIVRPYHRLLAIWKNEGSVPCR